MFLVADTQSARSEGMVAKEVCSKLRKASQVTHAFRGSTPLAAPNKLTDESPLLFICGIENLASGKANGKYLDCLAAHSRFDPAAQAKIVCYSQPP